MSSSEAASKGGLPSELVVSDTWDRCLERTIVNVGTGLVVGGLLSFVLARSPSGRSMVTAFGAGSGAGAAWVRCTLDFERKEI